MQTAADREATRLADIENDVRIDRWNAGVLDALRGKAKSSTDLDYSKGYLHGLDERRVHVVMPARPEGYYHQALEA